MIEQLLSAMKEAASRIQERAPKKVTLVHHNDTDGLSSASILLSAFQEIGIEVAHFSLEKPYPQVLEILLQAKGEIILFADFAGKIAPLIAQLNNGRNFIIILDHHPAERVSDSQVINLDGDLYGLKGDRDISASATCYLFADQLLRTYGSNGKRLAALGILGAIGDGFFIDGALSGINRSILEIASAEGLAKAEKNDTGDTYSLFVGGTEYPAQRLCRGLDTLGGVGYYEGGTELGLQLCMQGITESIESNIVRLGALKNTIFEKEMEGVKKSLKTTEHLQWFDVEERFSPMGIKMVGVFCNEIKDCDFLDRTKYLAGFQHIPNKVPGFGEIPFQATKISMRVSAYLTERIRDRQIPGLDQFLPEATKELGGFADACHGLSAATTIKIGEEEQLIMEIEKLLTKKERLV